MDPEVILKSALEQGEISTIEALILIQAPDRFVPQIYQVADALNQRRHRGTVTYVRARQMSHTNICKSACRYCTFSRRKGDPQGYTYKIDQFIEKLGETPDLTEVHVQGGLNPDLTLQYMCDLVAAIRDEFPRMNIHAFSPAEIWFSARRAKMPAEDVLIQLKDAGMTTMAGSAAEILNDKVRKKICPNKLRTAEWVEIMKTAHRVGLKTTSTMLFGHIEDEIHVIEHLEILRNIQRETGGITEFVPLPFNPKGSVLYAKNPRVRLATPEQTLKLIAVSRIYLDKWIPNIQAGWAHLGLDLALRGLNVGANDFGETMFEDDMVRSPAEESRSEILPPQMNTIIRRAGKTPRTRDTSYRHATSRRELVGAR